MLLTKPVYSEGGLERYESIAAHSRVILNSSPRTPLNCVVHNRTGAAFIRIGGLSIYSVSGEDHCAYHIRWMTTAVKYIDLSLDGVRVAC